MASADVGGYHAYYDEVNPRIYVSALDKATLQKFNPIPTEEEINTAIGTTDLPLDIGTCFTTAALMISSPRLPDGVYALTSSSNGAFYQCENLIVPPKLPQIVEGGRSSLFRMFGNCIRMIISPTIPKWATSLYMMFDACSSLKTAASIPKNADGLSRVYRDCPELTGEIIIRPDSLSSSSDAFNGTVEPITLYGDRTVCETLAATSGNGNVTWSPWYDPVPAVTDRGQGSYTTADDMTRMVRNGALAVDSYAPVRMLFHQGDIVREDEWNALVEAAQTIDPTVTKSSHYSNLNKIEAAFDSAL